MVGIVLVSHSRPLADAAEDLAKLMAKDVSIVGAGGLEDGDFGTSYDRILNAIEEIYTEDGVLLIMDMGSSVMTSELVLEDLEDKKICMADAPFVEGAVAAAVEASCGATLEEVKVAAEEAKEQEKF